METKTVCKTYEDIEGECYKETYKNRNALVKGRVLKPILVNTDMKTSDAVEPHTISWRRNISGYIFAVNST
jgi:hypothetical protein